MGDGRGPARRGVSRPLTGLAVALLALLALGGAPAQAEHFTGPGLTIDTGRNDNGSVKVTAGWNLPDEPGSSDPACFGAWQWQDGSVKVHAGSISGPVVVTAPGGDRSGTVSWTMPTPLRSDARGYVAEYEYDVYRDQVVSDQCAAGLEPMPRQHSVSTGFQLPSWTVDRCSLTLASGSGRVEIPGREQSATLGRGDVFAAGMVFTSGAAGATFRSTDRSVIRFGPSSRASLAAGACSRRLQFRLRLRVGTIWSKITPVAAPAQRLQVETTNGLVVVRGASFKLDARTRAGRPVMTVTVSRGSVAVTNKGRKRVRRVVAAGQVTRVTGSTAPAAPVKQH